MLYLDHAATTPCREEVWRAMRPYFLQEFGNPNSIHTMGRRARKAVEEARETIGGHLNCAEEEIVFTSGGSEADNLAVRGAAHGNRSRGNHIIASAIEHHAVLRSCESLEQEGFEVTYLGVDEFGQLNPEQVRDALRGETILVSLMHANNEIGVIQPIAEIARMIKSMNPSILFHTDAVQSVGHLETDVRALGVDLLSFAAHKFYGPKGAGGLFVKEGVKLECQIPGGGQEHDLRSGTLSVPLIVGMAEALRLACEEITTDRICLSDIRDRLMSGLLSEIEDSKLNGHKTNRLPNNVNVSFLGVSGEDVVLRLDRKGICASTGSACTTGRVDPSHVLLGLGLSRPWALGAVRFTLGHESRGIKPERVVNDVRSIVEELRSTNFVPSPRAFNGSSRA